MAWSSLTARFGHISLGSLVEASNPLMYLGLGVLLFLAAAVSRGAWPSIRDCVRYLLPPTGWRTASAWIDVFFYVLNKFVGPLRDALFVALSVYVAAGGDAALTALFGPGPDAPASPLVLALCFVAVFLAGDLSHFVAHWLSHKVPMLWELHKVHHSATFMSPITKHREHPLESLWNNVPPLIVFGVLLSGLRYGFALTDVQIATIRVAAGLAGLLMALDPFRHSHIRIGYGPAERVLLSPAMHQFHHSAEVEHFDKNFGRYLSIWDWMAGTGVRSNRSLEFPLGLGLGQDAEYRSVMSCLFLPLLKIERLATGWFRTHLPISALTAAANDAAPAQPAAVAAPKPVWRYEARTLRAELAAPADPEVADQRQVV